MALGAAGCGGDDHEPVGELAFFVTTDADYRLARAGSDGKRIEVVSGQGRGGVVPHLFARPSWSPDGQRLAFAGVESGDPAADARTDIHVMRADGSARIRITSTRDALEPMWTPDGRRIVFTRRAPGDGPPTGSLWIMDADGSHARELTRRVRGRVDLAGSSPAEGAWVAVTRATCVDDCAESVSAVFRVALDGSGERRLLNRAEQPSVAPDGRRIAFVSDRDRNGTLSYGDRRFFANELYVTDVDGSDQRRLTETRELNERAPAWSPDGERIAFQRGKAYDNAEGMSLHQVNPDGTCERAILADPKLDTWYASPAWRPGDEPGALEC